MPNLIISKVPSTSGTPGNLVIDKYVPTEFTPSTVGEVYWRYEDEPTATPVLFGSQRQGTTLSETIDLAGRAIRLFLVSRTKDGARSVTDVRLAEQVVFTPDSTLGILTDSGSTISDGGDVLTNG